MTSNVYQISTEKEPANRGATEDEVGRRSSTVLVELKRQPKISLVLPTNITRTVKLNLEGSENCCLNGISAILYILKLPRDKERMKARS